MGNNVDLTKMLGAPKMVDCPKCHSHIESYFDDYDIDCGDPNADAGKWCLDVYCHQCENEFYIEYDVILKEPPVKYPEINKDFQR